VVRGRDLLDERGEELRLRVDDGLQSLEAGDARLGTAGRGIAHNGCQDRHGAAVDVDERLRDHEVDYLTSVRLQLSHAPPLHLHSPSLSGHR
jgi:uncharacterized cupin superfamily protein